MIEKKLPKTGKRYKMDLTDGMKRALLQIGFGVTGRRGGFFDDDGERVDLRSAQGLLNRGLIFYHVRGANPMTGLLEVTDEGEKLFEELRYDEPLKGRS